MHKGVI